MCVWMYTIYKYIHTLNRLDTEMIAAFVDRYDTSMP